MGAMAAGSQGAVADDQLDLCVRTAVRRLHNARRHRMCARHRDPESLGGLGCRAVRDGCSRCRSSVLLVDPADLPEVERPTGGYAANALPRVCAPDRIVAFVHTAECPLGHPNGGGSGRGSCYRGACSWWRSPQLDCVAPWSMLDSSRCGSGFLERETSPSHTPSDARLGGSPLRRAHSRTDAHTQGECQLRSTNPAVASCEIVPDLSEGLRRPGRPSR